MGILVFPLIPDLLPSPQQLSALHLSPFPGLQKSRRQAARICTLHPHALLSLMTGGMSSLQDTLGCLPLSDTLKDQGG